ncbi:hypothetical protein VXS06_14640 [Photobacterium toruni]|uniref:Uncharacterized protein n=1 Tax=Photobacterium toruni TaxID=1935446 RepID=A0ABU6L8V0_9GAMM|nr:hypothetical protein [Photobacterium toruni]
MNTEYHQQKADEFYKQNGKCCSGCDHWSMHNHFVGECLKSQLMPTSTALSGIGIKSCTIKESVSHALTKRDYVCSNFIDTYDWGVATK